MRAMKWRAANLREFPRKLFGIPLDPIEGFGKYWKPLQEDLLGR